MVSTNLWNVKGVNWRSLWMRDGPARSPVCVEPIDNFVRWLITCNNMLKQPMKILDFHSSIFLECGWEASDLASIGTAESRFNILVEGMLRYNDSYRQCHWLVLQHVLKQQSPLRLQDKTSFRECQCENNAPYYSLMQSPSRAREAKSRTPRFRQSSGSKSA
jgi:hypothetical protein